MQSHGQIFLHPGSTVRAGLTCPAGVNLAEINTTLEAHPGQYLIEELPQTSIKGVLTQKPFGHNPKINILDKDVSGLVTEFMGKLELPIKAASGNLFVNSPYLLDELVSVVRPFLLSLQSALQQFKLALQFAKESRSLNLPTVRGRKEIFQADINPNGVPRDRSNLWNIDINLAAQDGIPPRMLAEYPRSFDHKPIRDWTVQNNWHQSNLGQFDFIATNRTGFELRKNKGTVLPKLFEAWETMPSIFSRSKRPIQSPQNILKHLRLNVLEMRKFFLRCRQVAFLKVIVWIGLISRDEVTTTSRPDINSVHWAFSGLNPVFALTQRIVVDPATSFEPRDHAGFLLQRRIHSVPETHREHASTIAILGRLGGQPRILFASLTCFHPDVDLSGTTRGFSRDC